MSDFPAIYKPILPLFKISLQFEKRDLTTAYWARFQCLQLAMKIDSKDKDGRMWLLTQMDWLEAVKKANADREEIKTEMVGQAHCENVALGLFAKADKMDRACQFSLNLSKLFYTASQLIEMLVVFGELSEDMQEKKKYAKWKTLYIKNCLDNGETPVPGNPNDPEPDHELETCYEDVAGPSHSYSESQNYSSYQPETSTQQGTF